MSRVVGYPLAGRRNLVGWRLANSLLPPWPAQTRPNPPEYETGGERTQEYNGRVGQPPIPPWVIAGVILYGLMRRIRSGRQLEFACGNNIDFMWLLLRRQANG